MTQLIRYSLISVLLVAICLGWYSSVLSDRLNKADKANEKLVDAVKDRDGTIKALKDAAGADRHATEEQLKIEQQLRTKADAENRTLRKALEHSDCSNQRLPDSAIDILRGKNSAPSSPKAYLRLPTRRIYTAMRENPVHRHHIWRCRAGAASCPERAGYMCFSH
ncbi:DUF2570 family protein [Serratia fonticola]|uniref:Protein of uncharacterized function (DUF2570) n=1 Tax=Serratia fonticola TaxID=47917 RepID=A0A3S5B4V3_SERFO|nr:DUF2570 family protein [Serratia fonticola]MBL5864124.1 DUF2570 family protein [Serratia fonticola]CAI1003709.1 Protein of uncharacterised function (DUF2570) [Serratia fonticola]VEI72907.1 Protein of uncharacterised function (DUF2570) [Serratia fonticola]